MTGGSRAMDGSPLAREFAGFWRQLLEQKIGEGVSLDIAAAQTDLGVAEQFGLEGGVTNYAYFNAVTILAHEMPDGHLLRVWENRRLVER